jgi:hypothetical protein
MFVAKNNTIYEEQIYDVEYIYFWEAFGIILSISYLKDFTLKYLISIIIEGTK